MGDFFKGWRRKVGVVALLLSCLFMVGWVRSQTIAEYVYFRCSPSRVYVFTSYPSFIMWNCREGASPPAFYGTLPASYDPLRDSFNEPTIAHQWTMCGIQSLGGVTESGMQIAVWIIPYWFIVIPLTLISAYLLLSKPRKTTQSKSIGPAPNEGT